MIFKVGDKVRIITEKNGKDVCVHNFKIGEECKIDGINRNQYICSNKRLHQTVYKEDIYPMKLDSALKFLDFNIRGTMSGIKYPCLVDVKYDGIPVLACMNPGSPTTIILQDGTHKIMKSCNGASKEGIYIAEWIFGEGLNNDLHQLLSERSKADSYQRTHIEIFDCLELEEEDMSKMPLIDRRLHIENSEHSHGRDFKSIIAESREEVEAFATEMIKQGYEGVIVKNLDETFAQQKWVKIKREEEVIYPVTKIEGNRFEVTDMVSGTVIGLAYNRSVSRRTKLTYGDRIRIKHNGMTKDRSLRNPIAIGRA